MEPSRGKSICVPFDSEEHYAACVTDLESFRQHLTEVFAKHPELFPAGISEGFVLHDKSWSIKQQVMLRRIALKATAGGPRSRRRPLSATQHHPTPSLIDISWHCNEP